MKVAIVHYWWLSNRGGEAVCSALVEMFPEADLFLHVCQEDLVRQTLTPKFSGQIKTTLISKLPGAAKFYQKYLPIMPFALEQIDLTAYDLIISSESGPAKGVLTRPDSMHICYCHSPMRYIWDMYHSYVSSMVGFTRLFFQLFAHKMRIWDRLSADRVDYFIANSNFVASRIKKYYRRESEVIYPPVDIGKFDHTRPRENFYLYLGQLVGYKRADLAVDAFNELGLPLIVVGEGELYSGLKKRAGDNIQLMGRQPFDVIKDLLERCRALVFPGVEDFGIVPVEAMAAGAPVIAYAKGGGLETVVHGVTGIHFYEQSTVALISAVQQLESGEFMFSSPEISIHAEKYSKDVFVKSFLSFVDNCK
ncbi:glycosyltransferase [Gynuella sunshinyii]|uniref:Glycosyltransferase n=1 Tax=Gynuella sunshinyii YC6258 TaxID=1445510 RepID=A0A0C5VPI9_9GAMM|nr:glycosyltransferase [Gynuella sunshinyii]AJQ95288.1 glycosyltransferase [Gynuella sunshinyii YC6258]